MLQSRQHLLRGQGSEPESCAPGLQSGNDLIEVVADDAKPDVVGKLLNNYKNYKVFNTMPQLIV